MRYLFPIFLLVLIPLSAFGENNETSPLLKAIENSDLAQVKRLLEDGVNVEERYHFGWKPIMIATHRKNTEVVKLLLAYGASPNADDVLGESALHVACGNSTEIARILIKAGANVNATNAGKITPLMRAAGSGDVELVTLLLAHGAEVNRKDYKNKTALDWAKRKRHQEIVNIFEPKK